jgi:myosin-light-chain kinase
VQWYRDGMELKDPRFVTHLDGLHSCHLTIQELRDEDSGRYMCEATNKVGRVSTFARLLVINDPKILEADHKLKRWVKVLRPAFFLFFLLKVSFLIRLQGH